MTVLMTLILLVGIGLLSLGAWLAWEPAGFMVAGASLIALPVLWVRGGRQ